MKKILVLIISIFVLSTITGFDTVKEKHNPNDDWKKTGSYLNVEFEWRYSSNKSAIQIKATNIAEYTQTIKILVKGGNRTEKMAYYNLKPGKSDISYFCAEAKDYACEDIKSIGIDLLSAK